jgi:hypothetical protein
MPRRVQHHQTLFQLRLNILRIIIQLSQLSFQNVAYLLFQNRQLGVFSL